MKDIDLIASWGWQNPPSDIAAQATLAANVGGDPFSAYAALELMDSAMLMQLRERCPADADAVDFASQTFPKLRAYEDQVRSLTVGTPYYERLAPMTRHPCMDKAEVVRECKTKDCAVMQIEGKRAVVVFSSYQSMMRFKLAGRTAKLTDPIEVALGDESRLVATGDRDDISAVLGDGVPASAVGEEQVDRVWDSRSNETREDEEQLELARLLDHAITAQATDISIAPWQQGYRILIRRLGRLVKPRTAAAWDSPVAQQIIRTLEAKSGANPGVSAYREPRDGAFTYRSAAGEVFLRLSFMPLNHRRDTSNKKSVSIRLLPTAEDAIDLAELRLPQEVSSAVEDAVRMPSGLMLVVGPMNSGKSTTLAAALGRHAQLYGSTKKRVSVEDPIERFIPDVVQVEVPHVMSSDIDENKRFNRILSGSKRHDINVYCVGEVRDAQTASFCVSVASSGHLAMSSLHAKNTILAFDILAKLVPEDMRFQLAESLTLIVSQRLVPALCPHCKKKAKPTAAEKKHWAHYQDMEGEDTVLPATIYRAGEGCDHCESGYLGYRSVCEVLPFTRAVRDAASGILDGGAVAKASRDTMAEKRTLTLAKSAAYYLKAGDIDFGSAVYL